MRGLKHRGTGFFFYKHYDFRTRFCINTGMLGWIMASLAEDVSVNKRYAC